NLNYNKHQTFNKESIVSLGIDLIDTKIYVMKNTAFYEDMKLMGANLTTDLTDENIELIILNEPKSSSINEDQLIDFQLQYNNLVNLAHEKGIKIIHIVSNRKWYRLFQDLILSFNIPLYLTNNDYSKLKSQLSNENIFIIEDFLYLKDFNYYSNDINNNL